MNVHMHTPINTHAHRKECIFCLMVMKVKGSYEQHRDRVGVLVLPLGDRPKLLGDTQGMRRSRKHFQASLYPPTSPFPNFLLYMPESMHVHILCSQVCYMKEQHLCNSRAQSLDIIVLKILAEGKNEEGRDRRRRIRREGRGRRGRGSGVQLAFQIDSELFL